MPLAFKPDWEETQERFRQWWNHEYFGRCALGVTGRLANPPPITPPPSPSSPHQKWYDLHWISRNMEFRLGRLFYGGEAFPSWNSGYAGVSALPTFLGCPIELDMKTGWWDPIIADAEHIDVSRLHLDENSDVFRFTLEMLQRAAVESRGKSIPSIGAFLGSGDVLAALRGTEQLLVDCIERPDEIRAAEEHIIDIYIEYYNRAFDILKDAAGGSTCWFNLWSPGKFYAVQNDFSFNIGPDMFRDLFLPGIRRQTEFLDHSVYHVDGTGAFCHVDALCELPRLQALQILPGAGKPSPLHYADVLRKVQQAGKNLHITIPAEEVETALGMLSARGLFIETHVKTEKEARQLLESVTRWSVDR